MWWCTLVIPVLGRLRLEDPGLQPASATFFFFLRYRGLNPGAFYLRATPLALFFILYFETGSHEVAEGLTKERERDRERVR